MKDALGNELAAGQLVLWNNLIAKVREVYDGRLETKSGNAPRVTLEITLQNPQPQAFVRVVDPASDKLIQSAMGGA